MAITFKKSLNVSGRKYRDVSDPLNSWGTLQRDIKTFDVEKLVKLLDRELRRKDGGRTVIKRALVGRINALRRGDGTRGPRDYHRMLRDKVGLPDRKTKGSDDV